MRRPAVCKVPSGSTLVLVGFLTIILLVQPLQGAEIRIGTIIDTVGMVDDRSSIASATGTAGNGSALAYTDSSLSNGGSFTLTKTVESGGSDSSSRSIDARKILQYNAAGTPGHLSTGESSVITFSGPSGSEAGPGCVLATGSRSGGNRSSIASASLEIAGATSLTLTSRTRLSPGDLQYSVSARSQDESGNTSGMATIRSSFTYGTMTEYEISRVTDRSMVSGLFDLFSRVYRGGAGAHIQAETRASGMVGSKTEAWQQVSSGNCTGAAPRWSGSSVYGMDILTNGGDLDEVRSLDAESILESRRVLTYHANDSSAMQTEERVVGSKNLISDSVTSSALGCIFAGTDSAADDSRSHQVISASTQLFGVDSAQLTSTAVVDLGTGKNGTMPLGVDFRTDITSPVIFDAGIVQVMTDPDQDGKYEDLNGNQRQDIQDLVLLFRNFEWLSQSSISPRFDFNTNGRVDLADLTHAFREIQG